MLSKAILVGKMEEHRLCPLNSSSVGFAYPIERAWINVRPIEAMKEERKWAGIENSSKYAKLAP